MIRTVAHQELGGGYAMGPRYTVDTAELEPGVFETMVLRNLPFGDADEMDCKRADNEVQARQDFRELLMKYAGKTQNAFLKADMKPGGRYTIFRLNEFGWPVAQKITFEGMELTTYAQHWDTVALAYRGARKQRSEKQFFFHGSFAICEGWQDLPENFGQEVLKSTRSVTISKSKYGCFDSRYFEDIKKILKNVLVVLEDYQTGADGKVYA